MTMAKARKEKKVRAVPSCSKHQYLFFLRDSIHHMVRSHAKQFMIEIENLRLVDALSGEAVAKPDELL